MLANAAKTIANCANAVIHVKKKKKEYKALDTKLSWDKLIVAKCQKQACLSSRGNYCPFECCTWREGSFSSLFFQLIVKQNAGNTMSLHIMDTWYFDVYIIFGGCFFYKNSEDHQ